MCRDLRIAPRRAPKRDRTAAVGGWKKKASASANANATVTETAIARRVLVVVDTRAHIVVRSGDISIALLYKATKLRFSFFTGF